jgi:hypothetical protein
MTRPLTIDYCLVDHGESTPTPNMIDTSRVILPDLHQVYDFEQDRELTYLSSSNLAVVEWLWLNAQSTLCGLELIQMRIMLAKGLIHNTLRGDTYSAHMLADLMDAEMLEMYTHGHYSLLNAFTEFQSDDSVGSVDGGNSILRLLASMGLNVELCILQELKNRHPGLQYYQKRVVFEKLEDGTMILRWEWAYDLLAAGYHIVSEFSALAGDADPDGYGSKWPFKEFNETEYGDWKLAESTYNCTTPKQLARFNRRTAAKHRRERARTGQKQHRSRMPGAWID